ncbi:PREDICTED: uncharacterized protein LOC109215059 [Nicotiana attenuata]|uniref:uncharacterized protein LOC109215059 n=1 Tax=Nicotiana attenuata TaxID=49451 RepID=UPI000905B270|nr:PREDICTED: uncharacterized protein LOC109215059 [Nicotiana attenuata]
MKTVPRDLFSISDQIESNAPHCYENEPSEHLAGSSIPDDNDEVVLVRNDLRATIVDVPPEGFLAQLEIESEEEFESEDEMNQAAALKKKVSNPNKAQSPMKNIGFDFQYRSSAELAKKFQIKREKLASDHKDKAMKEQASLGVKRKSHMPATSEGQRRQRLTKSDESVQKIGSSKLPMYRSIIQSPSREDLNTSQNIEIKGQSKQRLTQLEDPIQKQGMSKLPVHTSMLPSFSQKDPNTSHMIRTQGERQRQLDIQEIQNCKKVKKNSVLPSTSHNQFLEKYGIHVAGGKRPDIHPIDEHEIELEIFVEVGDDEFVRDEDANIDCAAYGTSEKKRVRGQTTCKNIHARSFEEREEVTFDKGQAVGPTDKRVSDLTNFIGTIARNPRFITLVHTSWHAVSKDIKQRMWEYVNFLFPTEGEKWVMAGLRDAWRRHKRNIKKKHFNKNATVEDLLQNRPNEIPEVQFCQLLEYWKD